MFHDAAERCYDMQVQCQTVISHVKKQFFRGISNMAR